MSSKSFMILLGVAFADVTNCCSWDNCVSCGTTTEYCKQQDHCENDCGGNWCGGGGGTLYCPVQNDYTYSGNIEWHGSGWTMTGSGGVHGKTMYNLLGGYVQFDIETTNANGGVNNNFYTSSPNTCCDYCDIQANSSPQCMELDIVENNGNCLSQVTWHTWPNKNGGCDENGCEGQLYASGRRTMKASFSTDGWMTVTINGHEVEVTNPVPSNNAKNYLAQQMTNLGVMFHSTQWVGWVPAGNCPGGGNVETSVFSIYDVKISGTVVQGSEPAKCTDYLASNKTKKIE